MKNEGKKFFWKMKWSQLIGSVLVVSLLVLPLLLLLVRGIEYGIDEDNVIKQMFVGRNLTLLIRSTSLAFLVSICCVACGFLIGLTLWNNEKLSWKVILYGLFLILLIPNYIHAQAWIFLVDYLNLILRNTGIVDWNFSGFPASWFILVMSNLAYGIGFSFIGLFTVNRELIELSRLEGRSKSLIRGVLLPGCKNYLMIAFNLIFVLCLVDYTIPSLFGVRVYPLYIYSRFSGQGHIGMAVIDSIPLICIGVLLLFFTYGSSEKGELALFWHADKSLSQKKLKFTFRMRLVFIFMELLMILWISVPFISLIVEFKGFQDAVSSLDEIFNTVSVSFLTASIGLVLSYIAAVGMRSSKSLTKVSLFILGFVFVMPAPLVGIGVNLMGNMLIPKLSQSIGILVLAGLIRFLPIGIVIMYIQTGLVNKEVLEAGKLYASGVPKFLYYIKLPMMFGGLLLTFIVMFALSAGELGSFLLVMPPGKGILTLKLYNYLHYGSSETVASLSLVLLTIILLPGFIYGLVNRIRNKHREEG